MISTLALLDLYDDAELERKRTAALFGAFITRPERTDEDPILGPDADFVSPITGDTQPSPALEPGVTVDLQPGEDIRFATPADVGSNFEPFQYRCLLRAAAGANIPYSDMTGDLRRTSFGSIRAGLVAHRRRVETMQQSVLIYQFCQRVWKRWWTEAVLAGALPVSPSDFATNQRSYVRADWIPPAFDWIDPLKDVETEQLLVENGFKSRSAVIKSRGDDPVVVDNQRKQDMEREQSLGLPPITFPTAPGGSGGPSASVEKPPRVELPVPGHRTVATSRDDHGNIIATVDDGSGVGRRIVTSRDARGNLTAVVEPTGLSSGPRKHIFTSRENGNLVAIVGEEGSASRTRIVTYRDRNGNLTASIQEHAA